MRRNISGALIRATPPLSLVLVMDRILIHREGTSRMDNSPVSPSIDLDKHRGHGWSCSPQAAKSLARRILFGSSVIVSLTTSSMAPAQVTIDVSKITCDELIKYEIADPKLIAIWISGYYHGLHKNPMVDKHQTLQSIDELEEYCFKHPNDLVMKEVGELLGVQ